jgi:hypothetical protein
MDVTTNRGHPAVRVRPSWWGARRCVGALPAVFRARGFSANQFRMVARNFTVEMLRLVRPKNQIVDRIARLIATD